MCDDITSAVHCNDIMAHCLYYILIESIVSGECYKLKSVDEGDFKVIDRTCLAPATLHLKVDAPVVLLVNVTNEIVNGLLGNVIYVPTDTVCVLFTSLKKTVPV